MALNFYKQSDIDAMDANNIPVRFKNYFKSLDYAGKVAILGNRYDLAEALGFKLPEEEGKEDYLYSDSENEIPDIVDSADNEAAVNIAQEESEESEEAEEEIGEEYDFSQISHNSYEGQSFAYIIQNNMEPLEALALKNNVEKCPLHHTPLKKWQIKYTQNGMYSMYVYTCEECHRIFMYEENMSYIHDVLVDKGVAHTFYNLDLTNHYLRSQMSEYEIGTDEKVYVPDLWIEEAPICPVHGIELYERPCCRSYKDRKVSFTGYVCEKCNKIMVRRAYIDELQDQCATIGVPAIEHESIAKKVPKKKPLPQKEVKPDYIIENGKREKYAYDHIADCYKLTEEDTVVVTDSIYCTLEGHDTEEVLAMIWVNQKRGGRKSYLFVVGYCAHCQKYYMDIDDYNVVYSIGRPEVTILSDIDDGDYQITSGEVFNLEKKHLGNLERGIAGEIASIQHSSDYVNPYAVGDYDDGNLSFAKSHSKQKYGQRLEDLTGYINKPYSYRVDISCDDDTETFYIGASDIVLDNGKKVISTNSELGYELINYQTITVKRNGKDYNIKLSRQFDIENAALYGYVNLRTDEDVIFKSGITDPFLVRVLNLRKRQHNLTDIFVTIQENQNKIVNSDFRKNIIVQGCAGSGKTMVLLHRLSALKYRNNYFDFSSKAMILTPNEQFSLHIKGLAEGLQIGNIHRVSVEQYYIDMLMQYDKVFKPENKTSSEMFVRQDYVDYIYSDQFRQDFDDAYDKVMAKRNTLIDALNSLTEAMRQEQRIISLEDDSKVILQLKNAVEMMSGIVQRQDQVVDAAKEELEKHITRKNFLEKRIPETQQFASGIVKETLSRVYAKIATYMKEKEEAISEFENQLQNLTEEQLKVQKAFNPFGKRAKLEQLENDIKKQKDVISKVKKQLDAEKEIFSELQDEKTDEEIVSWMRLVAQYIKSVQEDVRLCNNTKEEFINYSQEFSEIDQLIDDAEKKYNDVQENQYPDDVKRMIKYLNLKVGEYGILETYQMVFDEAVHKFKEENDVKNINGKYHRYDFYAQLLFAMKFFKRVYGTLEFMCIDEGQDLAVNEYRLIYELNQKNVIYNIFGDTNQLMKPGRGIADWTSLDKEFSAQMFTLNENYRNTNQITKFCNSSFGMDVLQTGVDGPSVREIPRRDLEKELADLNVTTERIAILVPRGVQKKKYIDTDILPKDIAKLVGDNMDNGYIAVMYVDEVKGIEFDKVFVVGNKMARNEKYIAYTRALSELILVVDDTVQDYDDGSGTKSKEQSSKKAKSNKKDGNGTLTWTNAKNNSISDSNSHNLEKKVHNEDRSVSAKTENEDQLQSKEETSEDILFTNKADSVLIVTENPYQQMTLEIIDELHEQSYDQLRFDISCEESNNNENRLAKIARIAGASLKEGVFRAGDYSDKEIFSVFEEFFSTTARKDTSYKYAFLKAILDELPDTDENLRISFDILFERFTKIYWPLVIQYGISQKSGEGNLSYVEQLILDAADPYGFFDVSYNQLSQKHKKDLIKKVKQKCKTNVVGALYGDMKQILYSFSKKDEWIELNPIVYDFFKRHREEIQEMNYNAWAEFSEKINDDKQIEKAKKKCGMPDSSGRTVFKAIMKSTFLSVPLILFTFAPLIGKLL